MRVCFIAEGCYPYEVGGVSSWIHSLMHAFPDIEFYLIAIVANRSYSGKFKYTLPDNLVSVKEVYLQDFDWVGTRRKQKRSRISITPEEYAALQALVMGEEVDWDTIFRLFANKNISVNQLLMSEQFMEIIMAFYEKNYSKVPFTDTLWTIRSIYLTLFLALKSPIPQADIYHCVSTGYAGVIGSMARSRFPQSRLLLSEHGIYTREREEEIIRAKWVQGIFKDIWISQFKKMSLCAYRYADTVTALFEQAHLLQLELGCPPEKAIITPNGINTANFQSIARKDPNDPYFNIGAILRLTPIKDIKTMITAFHYAQQQNNRLKLWIMGPDGEDPVYAQECRDLAVNLHAQNIEFTGIIRTVEYIGKMDVTILTSISEGQPLTILESFAAGVPCIATNVGNCFGLINGETDDYGSAGMVVPVMSIPDITNAMLTMSADPKACRAMGQVGYRRVMDKYRIEQMRETYRRLYHTLALGTAEGGDEDGGDWH